ncbi:MAG: flavodoxin family protein [Actinobacteria bacterium]|nr:flavodoxin family protein [Actinomycetota bacterium]
MQQEVFRILAIYGSPRREGNTDILMDRFLCGVKVNEISKTRNVVVDRVYVRDLNISSCIECRTCSRTGECAIDDDMQFIYEKLIDADFIAFASPVFFTTVSGYAKALIDRCQRFWALKYELKRKIITKSREGIFISTAGSSSPEIFSCARKVMRSFFDVIYVDYCSDFLFNNVDYKGDILKNEEALKEVYNFGATKKFGNWLAKE